MIYNEVIQDLFKCSDDYFLVHVTSADFDLNNGVGFEFDKRFDLRNKLKERFKETKGRYKNPENNGYIGCVQTDRIFTLIFKKYSWDRASYFDLEESLKILKNICIEKDIKKIAMPLIACGVNCLDWRHVNRMVQSVFNDLDIEILVCKKIVK